jgi:uncharacterized protein YbjT (DUF2867 family)
MILVTGGTGTLGNHVVPLLPGEVRILSRHSHDGAEYVTGDLATGEGLEAALTGVDTVLHLAGGPKGDTEATENLVRAASGVKHLVYVSVIGADRVPLAWFKSKLGAEQAVINSGIPWTILRAAQFHDLTLKAVRTMAKLPVVPIPGGLRFQPVDAREVATRLAELTLGEPAGLVPDLAGPKVYGMGDLVRSYLTARGKHRLKMPMRIPGKAGHAYRAGENLTLEGATTGTRTWEDFLTEQLPR